MVEEKNHTEFVDSDVRKCRKKRKKKDFIAKS